MVRYTRTDGICAPTPPARIRKRALHDKGTYARTVVQSCGCHPLGGSAQNEASNVWGRARVVPDAFEQY